MNQQDNNDIIQGGLHQEQQDGVVLPEYSFEFNPDEGIAKIVDASVEGIREGRNIVTIDRPGVRDGRSAHRRLSGTARKSRGRRGHPGPGPGFRSDRGADGVCPAGSARLALPRGSALRWTLVRSTVLRPQMLLTLFIVLVYDNV